MWSTRRFLHDIHARLYVATKRDQKQFYRKSEPIHVNYLASTWRLWSRISRLPSRCLNRTAKSGNIRRVASSMACTCLQEKVCSFYFFVKSLYQLPRQIGRFPFRIGRSSKQAWRFWKQTYHPRNQKARLQVWTEDSPRRLKYFCKKI